MTILKTAVSLLALAGSLSTQMPETVTHVGMTLRTQFGGINNQQRVSVVAQLHHTLPDVGLGRRARLGGTMFAYGAGYDDLPVATFLQPDLATCWFSLAWMNSIVHPVWFAEPGHNLIFGQPDHLTLPDFGMIQFGKSKWDYEQLAVPTAQGWDAWFMRIPIPLNSMLSGYGVSVQSYRYDVHSRFFVSDEAIFVIG